MQVLAIDPGITTGYVNARINANSPITLICDQDRMRHKEFWEFLKNVHPDLIICESFEYRSRARDNLELYSRELIGIANLYNQLNYDTKLIMQSAAQAKTPFDNDKLTSLGVYKKGKEHGRDAMRHFLYWLNFGHGYQFNVSQELHLV